jgi:hypothetical protein
VTTAHAARLHPSDDIVEQEEDDIVEQEEDDIVEQEEQEAMKHRTTFLYMAAGIRPRRSRPDRRSS